MSQTPVPPLVVLYADDDADDIELMETAFSSSANNVEIITTGDGETALELLQKLSSDNRTPSLVILDINMPRMNGKETLVRIRRMERFKQTPVVLFTTSSLEQDKIFAAENNAGMVTKPNDTEGINEITGKLISFCSEDVQQHILRRKS